MADICHDRHCFLFIQAGVLFYKENTNFWPILSPFANFGYFVANLRTFWCTFYIACWFTKTDKYGVCMLDCVFTTFVTAIQWATHRHTVIGIK